jgi:hypothetical protein
VNAPGKSAIVLVAFAAMAGTPETRRAGKVTNEPPPATAFIAPARKPAAGRSRLDGTVQV